MTILEQRNYQSAVDRQFEIALRDGRLTHHTHKANYVGDYMFMGFSHWGEAMFKNRFTREYLA